MKDKIKDICILLLACIAIVFIIKSCNKPIVNRSVKHTSDTIFVTNIDTIVKYDIVNKTKVKYYTNIVYQDSNSYHVYQDSIMNDTINVKFKAVAKNMKESTIAYKLNLPTKIIRKDSIITINNNTEIHDTVFKKVIGYTLSGGLQTQFSYNRYDVGPTINFNSPIGAIGYSYGILNKTHQVFLTVPIIKPKK